MKKIYYSILLAGLSLAFAAQAADVSLSVFPATSNVNPGDAITASVMANTSGDKICTVTGTVVFSDATCQNITVANGMVSQTSPTCSNPSFTIGIPKCATANTALFTIDAKAGSTGTASISLANVNIIGVGVSIGSASEAGTYTVASAPVQTSQPAKTTTATNTKNTGTPTATNTSASSGQTAVTTGNNQQANTGITQPQPAAVSASPASNAVFQWIKSNIIWDIIILLVVVYGVYLLSGLFRNKKVKSVK